MTRLKAALRNRFGFLPLLELQNKLTHPLGALRSWVRETYEVRRILRQDPTKLTASVVTIIPTYRRADALARAVSSALQQEVDDHKVIVIDDGGGCSVTFGDDRVRVVHLSRNLGTAGVVRNIGLRLSSSPYVAFLDDDNEWAPHHLTVALRELEQGNDLVYTALQRVSPDGQEVDVVSRAFDRRSMGNHAFVDTSALVVRRSRGVRFSRIPRGRQTVGEDWEFVHRLSRSRRTTHVPEVTVRYLLHDGSYFTDWSRHRPQVRRTSEAS